VQACCIIVSFVVTMLSEVISIGAPPASSRSLEQAVGACRLPGVSGIVVVLVCLVERDRSIRYRVRNCQPGHHVSVIYEVLSNGEV